MVIKEFFDLRLFMGKIATFPLLETMSCMLLQQLVRSRVPAPNRKNWSLTVCELLFSLLLSLTCFCGPPPAYILVWMCVLSKFSFLKYKCL